MRLRTCVYNPLSCAAPWRLLQIATTLKADILFLPGTTLRAQAGTDHTWARVGRDFWAVHFGLDRAPYGNKSAGCCMVLRSAKFSHKDVAKVFAPDKAMQGRGGAIRLKSRSFDVTPVVLHSPPVSGNKGQKAALEKTARLSNEWAQHVASSLPCRTLCLI